MDQPQSTSFFHWTYEAYMRGVFGFSTIFNLALLWIINTRSTKLGKFRIFSYAFAVIDIVYSTSLAFSVPQFFADSHVFALFPTSSLSSLFLLMLACITGWFTSVASISATIHLSFVYRYAVLCYPSILKIFEKRRGAAAIVLFVSAYTIGWDVAANKLMIAEDATRVKLDNRFGSVFGVDFRVVYYIGIDFETVNFRDLLLNSMYFVVVMSYIVSSTVFCGYRIHRTIASASMSEKTRLFHRGALRLLVLQALNPVVTMYVPLTLFLLSIVLGADQQKTGQAVLTVGALAIFPLANPFVILIFTDDYRNFLFRDTPANLKELLRSKRIRNAARGIDVADATTTGIT